MCFLRIYGCHSVFADDSVAVQMTSRVRLHNAPAGGEAIIAFHNNNNNNYYYYYYYYYYY